MGLRHVTSPNSGPRAYLWLGLENRYRAVGAPYGLKRMRMQRAGLINIRKKTKFRRGALRGSALKSLPRGHLRAG
jgi:hypothetical protein